MQHPAKYLFLKKSPGQAVLLVILGMAVVLTVVLSVVSRTVTDVSVTKVEEDSSKAFYAAEAGIEKLLIGDSNVTGESLDNQAIIREATSSPLGEGETSFSFPESYKEGDIATVWFVSHTDDLQGFTCSTDKPCVTGGTFTISWLSNEGAIEVSVYYDATSGFLSNDFSKVKVVRYAFDTKSNRGNNFAVSSKSGDKYSASLTLPSYPIFARVRFLYSSFANGFNVSLGSGAFPAQGRLLTSQGEYNGALRQVEVRDYYRAPLGIFEAGLASVGELSK